MTAQLFPRARAIEEVIGDLARRLWPNKTARNLAARAGRTPRSAEGWISGQTGMNADALADLLRSDAGLDVLDAVMGDHKPGWWPDFSAGVRIKNLEQKQAALAAEIGALRASTTDDRDRALAR